jgi:hypothetical protein
MSLQIKSLEISIIVVKLTRNLKEKIQNNSNNISDAQYYLYPMKHTDSWQYPNPSYNNSNQGDSVNKMISKYGRDNKVRRLMSATQRNKDGLNDSNEPKNGNAITSQNSKVLNRVSSIDKKLLKPSRINQEKLYERVIQLKKQNNSFKDENVKLQTQLRYLEKDCLEKEGIIEDYFTIIKSRQGRLGNITFNKKNIESYLTTTLKRQVKDLKQLIKEKENEITLSKKSPKSTKTNELLDIINQKEQETLEWRNLAEEYLERINRPKPAAKKNAKYNDIRGIEKELHKVREKNLILRSKTDFETQNKIDEMFRKHDEFTRTNKMKLIEQKKDNGKLQEQKKEILKKFGNLKNE